MDEQIPLYSGVKLEGQILGKWAELCFGKCNFGDSALVSDYTRIFLPARDQPTINRLDEALPLQTHMNAMASRSFL